MHRVRTAVLGLLAACACDRGPTPSVIEFGRVRLPPSAHDFYETESGLQETMLQARFDLPQADLAALEPSLHCHFGASSSAPSRTASVGTNQKSWYAPEGVIVHRDCVGDNGRIHYEALADVSRGATARVFLVIED